VSSQPADRPRILVLIKGLGIGGAERLISEGSEHWDRERFDYRVAYFLPWKDQLVGQLRSNGVVVDCIGSDKGLGPIAYRKLRSHLSIWDPHLIHTHLPTAGIMARLATSRTIVHTEHNIASSYRQPTRSANRWTYGRNAAVIAVSEAVAESLHGYPGPTPRVIPNGVSVSVDPSSIEAVRGELALEDGQQLVVHVGNIRPHKGHENLIAATAEIIGAKPEARVVSVGAEKHDGDLERVRASAEAVGMSGHIRFMGRREDAVAFLAAADVVVNPADFEGLPLAILEALALGKPVVATAVGGVPSVIVDRETGLLVPPRDPAALAKRVIEALDSPEANEWGRAGAELAEAEYGIARMIRDYEQVYGELLGG
jgi:glycosyltransferase involved in cell wall biosynthesis